MATIIVHVTADEKDWLQHMAKSHGMSLSALVLTYSLDELEDAYDRQVAQIAREKWLADKKRTIPMRDILTEFGNTADD